jgi:heme oxygenase
LAQALREGTHALHREVERTPFMQALLRGRVERARYVLLLHNLLAIYTALEGALARHDAHAGLAPLRLDGLPRAAPLAEDLLYLQGARAPEPLAVLPAARQYVERLLELERDDPALLAAHAYVRYLGDLSGGQALQRVVARALGLDGSPGTRFYAFGTPEAVAALARRFRLGLDSIAPDAQAAQRLVAEARRGFALHRRLFEQIAGVPQH